jgi:site-specific DNA recombinase
MTVENALPVSVPKRAITYSRVSTGKQQLHDLSIPDQKAQNRQYCEARGYEVVSEVVEAGSATGLEQRPRFQEIIEQGLGKPPPFDVIVVHSTSRFYRDEVEAELLRRRLKKNGVEVVSITQDFGEGPMADITRRIMGLVDELQSKETAKHVKRAMIAAAKQGWWMPARTPFGYVIKVNEILGTRKRRTLMEHPEDAITVRLIYKLATVGDGTSGRMGIKKIVSYLKDNGYRTRTGSHWYTSEIEKILKAEYYTGTYWFNKKNSREKVEHPREEWVAIPIPQIIAPELFQQVQLELRENAPRQRAPRITASQVLLTGIARCGACGGTMIMANGTSGSGLVYRYYKCAKRMQQGLCDSSQRTTVPEHELDQLVINTICTRLLTAERVSAIVNSVSARREEDHDSTTRTLQHLKRQFAQLTTRAKKLLTAVGDGLVKDDGIFKEEYQCVLDERANLQRLIDTEEHLLRDQIKPITQMGAEEVAARLRERLAQAPKALQKRLVRALVDGVVVSPGEIVIHGPHDGLAETASGAKEPTFPRRAKVHAFGRKWLPGQDSNLRPTG